MKPIEHACRIVGNQRKLAQTLNVTAPTINQWISGYRQVPAERCPDIEAATNGKVRCEDLRPDVNWSVLRSCQKVSTGDTAHG